MQCFVGQGGCVKLIQEFRKLEREQGRFRLTRSSIRRVFQKGGKTTKELDSRRQTLTDVFRAHVVAGHIADVERAFHVMRLNRAAESVTFQSLGRAASAAACKRPGLAAAGPARPCTDAGYKQFTGVLKKLQVQGSERCGSLSANLGQTGPNSAVATQVQHARGDGLVDRKPKSTAAQC